MNEAYGAQLDKALSDLRDATAVRPADKARVDRLKHRIAAITARIRRAIAEAEREAKFEHP